MRGASCLCALPYAVQGTSGRAGRCVLLVCTARNLFGPLSNAASETVANPQASPHYSLSMVHVTVTVTVRPTWDYDTPTSDTPRMTSGPVLSHLKVQPLKAVGSSHIFTHTTSALRHHPPTLISSISVRETTYERGSGRKSAGKGVTEIEKE